MQSFSFVCFCFGSFDNLCYSRLQKLLFIGLKSYCHIGNGITQQPNHLLIGVVKNILDRMRNFVKTLWAKKLLPFFFTYQSTINKKRIKVTPVIIIPLLTSIVLRYEQKFQYVLYYIYYRII